MITKKVSFCVQQKTEWNKSCKFGNRFIEENFSVWTIRIKNNWSSFEWLTFKGRLNNNNKLSGKLVEDAVNENVCLWKKERLLKKGQPAEENGN